MRKLTILAAYCCTNLFLFGQDIQSSIQNYFESNIEKIGIDRQSVSNWLIYDQHQSKNSPITYAYIRQTYEGIPIYDGIANFAINDATTVLSGDRLIRNLNELKVVSDQNVSALEAVNIAINHYCASNSGTILKTELADGAGFVFTNASTLEEIPVRPMYKLYDGQLRLVWDLSVSPSDNNHWWSVRVDAKNGNIIDEVDWTRSCNFGDHADHVHGRNCVTQVNEYTEAGAAPAPAPPATDSYRVFPIPIESPNHGNRSLVVAPSDPASSPYGWHDTNGAMGDEYTITRGNNVFAMEDVNGNNGTGYSPSSGGSNVFDYSLNLSQQPINYQDAAITNLFYMNNIMHDVWYHYGFDEASGNFQSNNYGNGGAQNDYVNADAQDGSGTNNANFSTPADGSKPRMQMYLWTATAQPLLTINSPAGVAGAYNGVPAGFGPAIPTSPLTADLALYDDGVPDENDACENAINGASLNGKIVVIRRGTCLFVDKIVLAESYGAVAVIMVNNVAGAPITMGGTDPGIGIPSLMVSDVDGEALIAAIQGGQTLNGTIVDNGTVDLDGDLDNVIIAHEYGHGISTRLTGGASNSNCLSNAEQMGEGWSDWFGLMLTIEPGDQATDNRGIGTYVTGESTTGYGIRPVPYNTDFAINNYTYDATNDAANISEPHGIGFVWCTMLWDMTWAFIDAYGFDPDVYNGTGGNNMAMELIISALKLQPCNPGFVDGRDAILQADQLLNGGANQCLIWNAFANRGLGYSADQGSANSRTDQSEAFDLPPGLAGSETTETQSACSSYTWPTNGNTYTSSGTYQAVLTNMDGCDSIINLNLTIHNPQTFTQNVTSCTDYTWSANGSTYSSSGSYTATLQDVYGCDSTVTLNLTISSTAASESFVTVCNSYTWTLTGDTYTTSGDYDTTVVGASGCDSVVTLHLTVNTPTSGSEDITTCDSYTWDADGQTYTSSGTYSSVLTGANGCDSTATLNLTVSPVIATIEPVTGVSLQATTPGATSYQWINCNTGNPVGGGQNQVFTSVFNGSFACIVTVGNCSDTSECLTISGVGIVENNFGEGLSVSPNPTEGVVNVQLGQTQDDIQFTVYSANGQLVDQLQFSNVSEFDYEIKGSKGMYLIQIQSNDKQALVRILKD